MEEEAEEMGGQTEDKDEDEAGDAANVKHDRRCITFTGCYGADIRHLPSFSHCG